VASTVESGFIQLLDRLRASQAEVSSAASHRASIQGKLVEAFGATAFFRTGSFGNGTNVSGFSDVDYFAVIPRENLFADSARTLERVAEVLRQRFPQTQNIRVNSPGVQLLFGLDGAEHTEVVPVDATGLTKLGFRQFDMPNGSGGWMFSAPESHNAYVSDIDARLAGKLKPLVRFLKAWRCFRNASIRSFYLELFAAQYASGEGSIVYDIDVKALLQLLMNQQLYPFRDPRFPNDDVWIEPGGTELTRQDALNKVQMAAGWAEEAVQSRLAGNERNAFERWNLVFNYEFPAYTGY
jgi:hypothetical protein